MISRRGLFSLGIAAALGVGLVGISYASLGASTTEGTPTMGTIPASATSGGKIDPSKIPDYVETLDQDGNVAGYVARTDILPDVKPGAPAPDHHPMTVYAADLNTVVGHMYPGKGFVASGADPANVRSVPVTTSPTADDLASP